MMAISLNVVRKLILRLILNNQLTLRLTSQLYSRSNEPGRNETNHSWRLVSAGNLGLFAMCLFDFAAYEQAYAVAALMGARCCELAMSLPFFQDELLHP